MFVDNEELDRKYAGLNPEFVRRVHAKRREQRIAPPVSPIVDRRSPQSETQEVIDDMIARAIERFKNVRIVHVADKVPVADILASVVQETGVPRSMLFGPSRTRRVVEARFKAIRAVADARPDLSTPCIGRLFRRDHTSILHALKKTKREGQVR